jgi:hypothetical protein
MGRAPGAAEEVGKLRADLAETRGKVDVLIDMMKQEHAEARENRRLMFDKLDSVDDRVASVEHKVEPIPATLKAHGEDIEELQTFRTHIGAVVAVAGVAVSIIVTGAGWLIAQFWDQLATWGRRLVG